MLSSRRAGKGKLAWRKKMWWPSPFRRRGKDAWSVRGIRIRWPSIVGRPNGTREGHSPMGERLDRDKVIGLRHHERGKGERKMGWELWEWIERRWGGTRGSQKSIKKTQKIRSCREEKSASGCSDLLPVSWTSCLFDWVKKQKTRATTRPFLYRFVTQFLTWTSCWFAFKFDNIPCLSTLCLCVFKCENCRNGYNSERFDPGMGSQWQRGGPSEIQ